jgi:hypothetical protein
MRGLSWALFILSTGVLFLRPQELYPDYGLQLFLPVIVPALVVSIGSLIGQLNGESMGQRPITVCALALLATGALSALALGLPEKALLCVQDFGKSVLFYLLLVGAVDTPTRLRRLLQWLVVLYVIALIPVVIDYYGVFHFPGIKHSSTGFKDLITGQEVEISRLTGTGLFADANDICLNLSAAIMLCLLGLADRRSGLVRFLWLLPLGFFGNCVRLTGSRGGALMVLAGILALIESRYRKSKALLISLAVLSIFYMFATGRQGDITISSGTGQSRVQLWDTGLYLFRKSPLLLGLGYDTCAANIGHAAHNSFVHAFVELGLVGGVLFFGAWYYALNTVYRLGSNGIEVIDPDLRRIRPYLFAMLVCYATGMMSLTETYIVPTWTMLGVATAFIRLAVTQPALSGTRFDGQFVKRMVLSSMVFLVVIHIFLAVAVSY